MPTQQIKNFDAKLKKANDEIIVNIANQLGYNGQQKLKSINDKIAAGDKSAVELKNKFLQTAERVYNAQKLIEGKPLEQLPEDAFAPLKGIAVDKNTLVERQSGVGAFLGNSWNQFGLSILKGLTELPSAALNTTNFIADKVAPQAKTEIDTSWLDKKTDDITSWMDQNISLYADAIHDRGGITYNQDTGKLEFDFNIGPGTFGSLVGGVASFLVPTWISKVGKAGKYGQLLAGFVGGSAAQASAMFDIAKEKGLLTDPKDRQAASSVIFAATPIISFIDLMTGAEAMFGRETVNKLAGKSLINSLRNIGEKGLTRETFGDAIQETTRGFIQTLKEEGMSKKTLANATFNFAKKPVGGFIEEGLTEGIQSGIEKAGYELYDRYYAQPNNRPGYQIDLFGGKDKFLGMNKSEFAEILNEGFLGGLMGGGMGILHKMGANTEMNETIYNWADRQFKKGKSSDEILQNVSKILDSSKYFAEPNKANKGITNGESVLNNVNNIIQSIQEFDKLGEINNVDARFQAYSLGMMKSNIDAEISGYESKLSQIDNEISKIRTEQPDNVSAVTALQVSKARIENDKSKIDLLKEQSAAIDESLLNIGKNDSPDNEIFKKLGSIEQKFKKTQDTTGQNVTRETSSDTSSEVTPEEVDNTIKVGDKIIVDGKTATVDGINHNLDGAGANFEYTVDSPESVQKNGVYQPGEIEKGTAHVNPETGGFSDLQGNEIKVEKPAENKNPKFQNTVTLEDGTIHPIVKKGDIIKYEGKDYEVTSGNDKHLGSNEYLKSSNIPYFRGREVGTEQDRLLHTNRIDGFQELQKTKSEDPSVGQKPTIEELDIIKVKKDVREKILAIVAALNDGRKEKDLYKNLEVIKITSAFGKVFYIASVENKNSGTVYNLFDENGETPDGQPANWRIAQLIQNDLNEELEKEYNENTRSKSESSAAGKNKTDGRGTEKKPADSKAVQQPGAAGQSESTTEQVSEDTQGEVGEVRKKIEIFNDTVKSIYSLDEKYHNEFIVLGYLENKPVKLISIDRKGDSFKIKSGRNNYDIPDKSKVISVENYSKLTENLTPDEIELLMNTQEWSYQDIADKLPEKLQPLYWSFSNAVAEEWEVGDPISLGTSKYNIVSKYEDENGNTKFKAELIDYVNYAGSSKDLIGSISDMSVYLKDESELNQEEDQPLTSIETGRNITLVEKNPEVVEDRIKPRLEKAAEQTQDKRAIRDAKIDDEIAGLWDDFASSINAIKKLDGDGPNAQALAAGIKLVTAYTKKGYYKLADMAEDAVKMFGQKAANEFLPFLKDAYNAVRGRDKENRKKYNTEDEVDEYELPEETASETDFEFEKVLNKNNQETGNIGFTYNGEKYQLAYSADGYTEPYGIAKINDDSFSPIDKGKYKNIYNEIKPELDKWLSEQNKRPIQRMTQLPGAKDNLSPKTREFLNQINEYPENWTGNEWVDGNNGVEFTFYNPSTKTESRYYVEGDPNTMIDAVTNFVKNTFDNSPNNDEIADSNNDGNGIDTKGTTGERGTELGGDKLDKPYQGNKEELLPGIGGNESDIPGSSQETGEIPQSDTGIQQDGTTTGGTGGVGQGGDLFLTDPLNTESSLSRNFRFPEDKSDDKSFNQKSRFQDNLNALKVIIELLRNKSTHATPEQQAILSKYVGWGGIKAIIYRNEGQFTASESNMIPMYRELINEVIPELENLIGKKNILRSIRESVLNAHYTSIPIIRSIYNAVRHLGFQSGHILEPSAGIGNFFGAMPADIMERSVLTSIEKEPLTGTILNYLYPHSNNNINGYEKVKFKKNHFDLIISNVPFGSFGVSDSSFKNTELEKFQGRIHNYFFIKSLQQVREGGLIAFVTSAGLMDSKGNHDVREYISKNSDFLGAIRLPNTSFKGNANTEVVTDIIFLRKNSSPQINPDILSSQTLSVAHKNNGQLKQISVNKYFIDNPENVIGEFMAGGLYEGETSMTLVADKDVNVSEKIDEIVSKYFPKGIYRNNNDTLTGNIKKPGRGGGGRGGGGGGRGGTIKLNTSKSQSNNIVTQMPEEVENGLLFVNSEDGLPYIKNDDYVKTIGELEVSDNKQPLPKSYSAKKVSDFVELRDALNNQYELESGTYSENEIEQNRQILNDKYENFVSKHGRLNEKKNSTLIKKDINVFNILSLENYDEETGGFLSKADIFEKRVIQPHVYIESADNIDDAISISYNEHGYPNIQRIADLLSTTEEKVMTENYGTLFYDENGTVVTRSEYLSGNVKKKLVAAKKMAETNSIYQKNVEELEAVIPEDIPATKIDVNLGVRWIPAKVYGQFAEHLFNTRMNVVYLPLNDQYDLSGGTSFEIENKWAVRDGDGRVRANGKKILQNALMQKPTVIYDTIEDAYGNKTRVYNKTLSERANEKTEQIQEEFSRWIWSDYGRRETLGRIYNNAFNNTIKRTHDGSNLKFSGMNSKIKLADHQKDGIAMIINNIGGIIDHIVGAGKTYLMIGAAIKLKQLGLVKKPMIIGLKSTIPHLVADSKKLYPTAKILRPTQLDFTPARRKQLLARIQNNDYDLIIISHEQFQKIPQNAEFQAELIQEEIAALEEALDFATKGNATKAQLKGLETRITNLRVKLENLMDVSRDEEILDFKRIGIDKLFVDESQQFKNLAYATRITRVAGLGNPNGSQRSFNLLTAARTLQRIHQGDKGVTFLSGTPISNSLVEMYLLLKYLRPEKMKELGYSTFDAWVSQFAVQSTELESSVTGQLKTNTRFREFINLPELSMLYNEIADVRNDNNLVLPKPKMRGGKPILISVPQSELQEEWTNRIVKFSKQSHGKRDGRLIGKGELTESEQNAAMLMATSVSNKLSLDMRLIDRNYDENPNGKIAAVADMVTKEYNDSNDILGTQMIFLDTGTPKTGKIVDDLKGFMEDEMNISGDEIEQIFGDNPEKLPPIKKVIDKIKEVLEWDDEKLERILKEAKESQGAFNAYAEIKNQLIKRGIPAEQIQFIHDYNSDKKKSDLFDDVNAGKIRVLLGSTQKLGTGVNAQKRIVALHHVDALWNPAGMEQRNGRGLRQGNMNAEVAVYQYGTERTQDIYKYDLVSKKGKFITQIKSGAIGDVRNMKEDAGEDSSAAFVAMLSGDPLIMEKIKVDGTVDKLKRSQRNFQSEVFNTESKLRKAQDEIPRLESFINRIGKEIEVYEANKKLNEDGLLIVTGTVDGKTLEKPKELGEAIVAKKKELLKKPLGHTQTIGTFNGFTLTGTVKSNDLEGKSFKVGLTLGNELFFEVTSTDDPTSQVLAIRRQLTSLAGRKQDNIENIERTKQNIQKYQETLNNKWDKEDELNSLLERQKVINEEFKKREDDNQKENDGDTGNTGRDDASSNTDLDENQTGTSRPENIRFQKTRAIEQSIESATQLAETISNRLQSSNGIGKNEDGQNRQQNTVSQTKPVSSFNQQQSGKGNQGVEQFRPSNNKLNAKQVSALNKVFQKVFPNVEFVADSEQYNQILSDLNINDVRFTSSGFIYNGKLYVDPSEAKGTTQIHEVIHIFTSWAARYSPEVYRKMIALGKQAPQSVIDYVAEQYPELDENSDAFAEEVFTTFAGEQLEPKVQKLLNESEDQTWYKKIQDAIKELVSRITAFVRNNFGVSIAELKEADFTNMNITEFADYLGTQLLGSNKISDITSAEINAIEGLRNQIENDEYSKLTDNEANSLFEARTMLSDGHLMTDITAKTGWSINPATGNWTLDENSVQYISLDETIPNKYLQKNGENRNFTLNKTSDGISYLSESTTDYPAGTDSLQQSGDTGTDNFTNVKNVWAKYKNLQFTGTTKVKSHADVAEIMKLLENKTVEHAFAVHVDKDGNSHIQFMSIGGVTGTVIDEKILLAGISKFGSQKVYLVHNHPSGKMVASEPDKRITQRIRNGLEGTNVELEHVIMDTYKKEYIVLDQYNNELFFTRTENRITNKLPVHFIDEQIVLNQRLTKVLNSEQAATFIQQLRFSAFPKNAALLLNMNGQVIGNYIFQDGIKYGDILRFIGNEANSTQSIIFYGNQDNLAKVTEIKSKLKYLGIEVWDHIVWDSDTDAVKGFYKSYASIGMLNETQEEYGTNIVKKNNIRFQKTARDIAALNNQPTLDAIETTLASRFTANPDSLPVDLRSIFDEYVNPLATAKNFRGYNVISQDVIDTYNDDDAIKEMGQLFFDKAFDVSPDVRELYNRLFSTDKSSILNIYNSWLKEGNYTILEQDSTGNVEPKTVEFDDVADTREIIDEKDKLQNNKSGILSKLFSNEIAGKKLSSLLVKNKLFNLTFNMKTLGLMFGSAGTTLHKLLIDSVEKSRDIAAPYKVMAKTFENKLVDEFGKYSVWMTGNNISNVEKMEVYDTKGTKYDFTIGEVISIIHSSRTQKSAGNELISVVDSKVKFENFRDMGDIEFSLSMDELERIENEIESNPEYKKLSDTILDYYNSDTFVDSLGNIDNNKQSLFGMVQNIFEIDQGKKLSRQSLYVPLLTYENNKKINEATNLKDTEQLLNEVSILHERTKEAAPLVLKDAFQVLHDYNRKTTNFIENWIPVRNLSVFLIRNEQWFKNNGMQYLHDAILNHIQNLNDYDKLEFEANKSMVSNISNKLRSGFVVSRLSLNMFTALKQFWGYPIGYGLGIIKDKYLTAQMGIVAKDMGISYGALVREFINYMSGKRVSNFASEKPYVDKIASNKYAYQILDRIMDSNLYSMNDILTDALGYGSQSDSKVNLYWHKFLNFFKTVGMSQIRQADIAVIIGMYNAAEQQVMEEMPDASEDRQQREIARLATEIMFQTQQTNTLSDKTQLQLSHDAISKQFTTFTAQTQKMQNTVLQKYALYAKETDPDKKLEYGKQFNSAITTMYIGNAFYMSLITTLSSILRGRGSDDDEYFVETFKWNFLRELAQFNPNFVGELGAVAVSYIDNQAWTDEVGGINVYSGVTDAVTGVVKTINSQFANKTESQRNKEMADGIKKMTTGIADMTGVSQELIRLLMPSK